MAADIVEQGGLVPLAIQIVSAYVARNHVQAAELPGLISNVHASLQGLTRESTEPPEERHTLTAGAIRRSIQPEGLVSFEDGRAYKTLRRHLTKHGLTPEAYRTKWGLSADYPMTAPAYSAQRSQLTHSLGLGRLRATAPKLTSAGSGEAAERMEDQPAESNQPGDQMAAEVAEQTDVEGDFDEGITREPFEDDGPAS